MSESKYCVSGISVVTVQGLPDRPPEPAVVDGHGRPVVVEMLVEELEKLTGDTASPSQNKGED